MIGHAQLSTDEHTCEPSVRFVSASLPPEGMDLSLLGRQSWGRDDEDACERQARRKAMDPELQALIAELHALAEDNDVVSQNFSSSSGSDSAVEADAAPATERDTSDSDSRPTSYMPTDMEWADKPLHWVMPFRNFRAWKDTTKLRALIRELSARSRWLVTPEAGLGTGSVFHKNNKFFLEEVSISNSKTANRHRFPTFFSDGPERDRSVTVGIPEPKVLPRWKDRRYAVAAGVDQNLIVLACQVAGIASGSKPSLEDLSALINSPDVGLFSFSAPAHLERELIGNAKFISKKLMRRLPAEAASFFAWRREHDGALTVFGALARGGSGSTTAYVEAAEGLSFALQTHAAGLQERRFRDVHPTTWARLYGFSDATAFLDGWTDHPGEQFPDDVLNPLEFDFAAKRFRTRQEVHARHEHRAATWCNFVERSGLPRWFGGNFLKDFRELFIRDEATNQRFRRANDVLNHASFKSAPAAAAQARREQEVIEQDDRRVFDTLRFYRGSPLQFVALLLSQGTLEGTYCDAEFKACGKDAYDQVRSQLR
jgi:hypothetical protein